ncbi:MAG: TIGR02285 family protein [Pseudomonas sp.]
MPALPLFRRLALLALCVFTALPAAAEKPRLIWTIRDMPPFTILEGPLQQQGIADRMLKLLTADMPQYEHIFSVANRARATQILNSGVLTCDPGLLWSKEREQSMYFSIPTMGILTNGVVVRKVDEEALAAFIQKGEFDLAAFLADGRYTLGTLVERSYGKVIDAELKQANPKNLVIHHGIDATLSLLRMQQHQRLNAVLGYWPELRYQSENAGVPMDALNFYPVKGVPTYQLTYVTCSKTPEGLEAIKAINASVRRLREGEVIDLYAQWLDGATRTAYLKAAKGFFKE